MTTPRRPQQRYDHRLRDLVQRTEDVTIATGLGVPRSTARGWLGQAPKVVIRLDVTDLRASELQHDVVELRRRVKTLTALTRWRASPPSIDSGAPAVPASVAESVPCSSPRPAVQPCRHFAW